MVEKIYDLRDPDWVPPHLRAPELDDEDDPVVRRGRVSKTVWLLLSKLVETGHLEVVEIGGEEALRRGPKYEAPIQKGKPGKPEHYQFSMLQVGGEFVVFDGPGRAKWESFRTYVARRAKELGFKLKAYRNENNSYVVKREA